MQRKYVCLALCLFFLLPALLQGTPSPGMKFEKTTKMQFKGMLGTMLKLFGAGKPVRTVEYVQGNLRRTDHLDKKGRVTETTIIDLDRELIITIRPKKKEYTQMTFEEWKQMIESSMQGLFAKRQAEQPENPDKAQTEVRVSFTPEITRTGETKKVSGYEAEKVLMTLKMEAEAEQTEENVETPQKAKGGLLIKSTNWLSSAVAGYDEVQAFNKRMAEKLGMAEMAGQFRKLLENVMKNDPALAEAMKTFEEESKKLEGVPLKTHSVFATWGERPHEKMAEGEPEKTEVPKSVGGLFKGFGKKLAKKKKKDKSDSRVLLETTTSIEKIENKELDPAMFQVPAGFERKEVKTR